MGIQKKMGEVPMKNENKEKLSLAMRKYLVGKELLTRLKKAEGDYIRAADVGDVAYLNTHKMPNKSEIADGLGKECHLSGKTVLLYADYAEVLEQVKERNEKLVQQVLAGETLMTYRDLRSLLEVL